MRVIETTLLALLLSGLVTSSKFYEVKKESSGSDSLNLKVEFFDSNEVEITFATDYQSASRSIVFYLFGDKPCPGYAYWFSKTDSGQPTVSLHSACDKSDPQLSIKPELAIDFAVRPVDAVENSIFKFKGSLYYTSSMETYGARDFKKMRVIRQATSGQRIDETYELK